MLTDEVEVLPGVQTTYAAPTAADRRLNLAHWYERSSTVTSFGTVDVEAEVRDLPDASHQETVDAISVFAVWQDALTAFRRNSPRGSEQCRRGCERIVGDAQESDELFPQPADGNKSLGDARLLDG